MCLSAWHELPCPVAVASDPARDFCRQLQTKSCSDKVEKEQSKCYIEAGRGKRSLLFLKKEKTHFFAQEGRGVDAVFKT